MTHFEKSARKKRIFLTTDMICAKEESSTKARIKYRNEGRYRSPATNGNKALAAVCFSRHFH